MPIVSLENVYGERAGVCAGTELKKGSGICGANLPAGVFVKKGAAQALNLPAAAADVPRAVGVLIYNPIAVQTTTGLEFTAGDQAVFLEQGSIYCISENALVAGADVFVRCTANGAGKLQLGAVRADADSGNCVLMPGARVIYDTTGTNPALIAVNLPQ